MVRELKECIEISVLLLTYSVNLGLSLKNKVVLLFFQQRYEAIAIGKLRVSEVLFSFALHFFDFGLFLRKSMRACVYAGRSW